MSTQRDEKILAFRREALIETAAQNWRDAMAGLKEAEALAEQAQKELIEACGNQAYEGKGVKLAEIERKGSIDYTAIEILKSIDLEKYRKTGSKFWKITLSLIN